MTNLERLQKRWRSDKVYCMVEDAMQLAMKAKGDKYTRYESAIGLLSDALIRIRLAMGTRSLK